MLINGYDEANTSEPREEIRFTESRTRREVPVTEHTVCRKRSTESPSVRRENARWHREKLRPCLSSSNLVNRGEVFCCLPKEFLPSAVKITWFADNNPTPIPEQGSLRGKRVRATCPVVSPLYYWGARARMTSGAGV